MRDKLIDYVRNLFRYAPKTKHNQDLEAEILQNSLDRFDDLIAGGVPEETAYQQAVHNIGDVRSLMDQAQYQPMQTTKPKRKKWGWILGGVCLVLVLLLGASLTLGWLFTARSFGGRHGDLEDLVENWADGVEESAEGWVQEALQDSDVVQVFGSRVSYPYSNQYQKGGCPISDPVIRLNIHWISGTVQIMSWDGDTVVLEEMGTERTEELLRWRLNDGVLTVQYCEPGTYQTLPAKDLVVKLPADQAEGIRVQVETVSAECGVAEMNLRSLDVNSTSGNVTAAGDYGRLSVESVSGEVYFHGSAAEVEVDTTSGDTELVLTQTPDELSYDAVSGDLTLTLGGGRGFRIDLETVSGDLDGNFALERRDGDYLYLPEGGSAMAEFEVNTVSGDVKVLRAE